MIFLNLDRKSEQPMFRQVFDQLKKRIEQGVLKPGEKLPSTRAFSNQLGINRATIYKAYQELWALGYIESRSGSYSYIRQPRQIKAKDTEAPKRGMDWKNTFSPNAEKVFEMFGRAYYPFNENAPEFDGIDFGKLRPDTRIFPVKEIRQSFSKVIADDGEYVLDYGESKGYKPLREYIVKRSGMHGVSADIEEILITNGAQEAIDLIMKLFAKPGGRVLTESPTYGMIFPSVTYYNCELVGIPMTDDGIDLDKLEEEIKKEKPLFLYTMPNFHNPTGITTSQEHREELLSICEKYSVPVVEDAFEEEMKYFGKVALPLKSMDYENIVIYIGSFSKVLFPGMRIGWIAADKECVERLAILKRFGVISSSLPEQAALAEFCSRGNYELHLKKIHKIYRKRMQAAVSALHENIKNKNVSWIEPNGGFTLWIKMIDCPIGYDAISDIFERNSIRVALGKDFFPIDDKEKYFRMAISSLNEEEIAKGIERLARGIEEVYNG